MVSENCRNHTRLKLLYATTEKFLTDHLKKSTARWIPKTLSLFERELRIGYSEELLQHFRESKENFLVRNITGVGCGFTTMIRNPWNKAGSGNKQILKGQSDQEGNGDPERIWPTSIGMQRKAAD
uniref:Uncharacterized protein n=1 Tax=Trichuris muris TaxID=70415 RepID=A0A5S6Q5N3_TRIMR